MSAQDRPANRKVGENQPRHRYRFELFDGDRLCTTIDADFESETLQATNYVDTPIKTAFGNNAHPTWKDFWDFLQERCVPRERAGLQEYLKALGLYAYDPIEIIQKTQGRMAEDSQWLKMEVL